MHSTLLHHLSVAGVFALSLFTGASATESFETFPQGQFTSLATEYGQLKAESGHGEIVNKAKTGEKSLRICGGDNKSLELTLKEAPKIDVGLSAYAERWSGREPFSFTITAQGPYGDKEIFNGTKTVKPGSFTSKIDATVPAKTTKLIFKASTAEGTGMMIDEFYVVPTIPMKFKQVSASSSISPAMVGMKYNPVVRIDVETEGGLKPFPLDGIFLNMTGTDMKNVECIEVFRGGENPNEAPGEPFGEPVTQLRTPKAIKIPGTMELKPGVNRFWVSVQLKKNADIDKKIVIAPLGVSIKKKPVKIEGATPVTQRIGYAIAPAHSEVLPSKRVSKSFRIPGMVRTKKGTLVAICDIRYNHAGDLPADIDVGVSRSLDGGRTWTPMTVAVPFKEALAGYKGAGNGDAAILVDEKTGRLWTAILWSHGKHPIWASEQGDNSPEKCSQFILSYSDDDGVTWSKPINITEQVKKPEWGVNFQGPGSGICLKDGTLVFPCQFWFDVDGRRTAHASLIYSKDGGKTWKCGTACRPGTSEAQVVELADGSVMINSRNERRSGYRVVYVTKDLGQTWKEHATNDNKTKGLMEPGACQGSIIAVQNKGGDRPLFFSNPSNHQGGRKNMTLKASLDQGDSWPEKYQILYDERSGAGYSSLAPADDKHMGVFYEGANGNIYFLRFPYSEIFKK